MLGRTILKAGLLAGTLDAAAAMLNNLAHGGKPLRVWVYVASAVFGPAAYGGSMALYVAIGLLFHYTVATGWSAGYALVGRRLPLGGLATAGPIWGVVVWAAMAFVVVPLTRVPGLQRTAQGMIIMILIHIFCVGLPIVWVVQRETSGRRG